MVAWLAPAHRRVFSFLALAPSSATIERTGICCEAPLDPVRSGGRALAFSVCLARCSPRRMLRGTKRWPFWQAQRSKALEGYIAARRTQFVIRPAIPSKQTEAHSNRPASAASARRPWRSAAAQRRGSRFQLAHARGELRGQHASLATWMNFRPGLVRNADDDGRRYVYNGGDPHDAGWRGGPVSARRSSVGHGSWS